jgi:hypothetical protein
MRGFVQRAKTLLNLTIKTQQLGKLRFVTNSGTDT